MEHKWEYCPTCQVYTVICGTCGLNQCSGGTGKDCPDCESAYQLSQNDFHLHNKIIICEKCDCHYLDTQYYHCPNCEPEDSVKYNEFGDL